MVLQYPILGHEMMPAATMQWLREDMRAYLFHWNGIIWAWDDACWWWACHKDWDFLHLYSLCLPSRQTVDMIWGGEATIILRSDSWFNFWSLGSLVSSACLGNLWRKISKSYHSVHVNDCLFCDVLTTKFGCATKQNISQGWDKTRRDKSACGVFV